ncbi:hypothetical protein DFP91_2815 [Pseudorhodoplanes sinuspersici]|nr:hypothetical protein DFP91_2815 [Pseudorhodoplanes sinuspersici]
MRRIRLENWYPLFRIMLEWRVDRAGPGLYNAPRFRFLRDYISGVSP